MVNPLGSDLNFSAGLPPNFLPAFTFAVNVSEPKFSQV